MMKFSKSKFSLFLSCLGALLLLQSCCDGQKLGDVLLTDRDKASIGYQTGDEVMMRDSSKTPVSFLIQRGSYMESDNEDCCANECCRDYFEYESEYAYFQSDSTANWSLQISQSSRNSGGEKNLTVLKFSIASPSSGATCYFATPMDSVPSNYSRIKMEYVGDFQLGENTFNGVYKLIGESYNYSQPDCFLYYDEAEGIIKVDMNNGETLELM